MNRYFLVGMAVWAAVVATQGVAQAQQAVQFLPTGVADWATGTNWQDYGQGQNVPEGQFNETVVISSGGTAFVNTIMDDSTSPRGPGAINVTNGELEIRNAGAMTLGQPAEAVLVDRSVTIGDTLNIQGAGKLNAAMITFQGGATFDVDVTAGTNSPVNVSGAAILNGALALDYSGLVNPLGSRTLITADSVLGSFSSVNTTGLGAAQGVQVATTGGLVKATVQNLLTLTVNRQTGAMTINNTHGTGINLDGYTISSVVGSLHPTSLTGLGAGWTNSALNSPNKVTQLFEGTTGNPSATIAGGAMPSISAGGLFSAPAPTAFLQDVEDLRFQFSNSTGTVDGIVNYTGGNKVHNNIVLTINSAGQAALLNTSPFSQEIESYRITSTGSPLQRATWSSLDDQNTDDGTWSESNLSGTSMLLEVQENSTTTFNNSTLYNIGKILNAGFSQTGLTFEFLLAGGNALTQGVVVFGALPTVNNVPGDYNGNHIVDAADYTVWRDHLGSAFALQNEVVAPFGQVTQADYDAWKARFGNVSGAGASQLDGAGAVPEPGSVTLVMLALCSLAMLRGRIC